MASQACRPWGKLKRDRKTGVEIARFSLIGHSADVAAVTEALCGVGRIQAQLARATGREGFSDGTLRAIVRAAFLHDLGKCNAGFQAKADPDARDIAGHVREIAPLLKFGSSQGALHAQAAKLLGRHVDPYDPHGALVLAAASHHGDPITAEALRTPAHNMTRLWRPRGGYTPMDGLKALAEALERWLPAAEDDDLSFMPAQDDDGDDDTAASHAFMHAVAGLVSLADWIASNDAEGFFPYDGHGDGDRFEWARGRAADVLRAMRLDPEPARAAVRSSTFCFGESFGGAFEPRPLQAAMARDDLGPIVVLEDDTGSGKTEAALWRFKTLFERGEVDSLYFALPTRIAATQIYERVNRFITTVFPEDETRPNVVLAVPGYVREGDDEGRKLSRYETLWPDDPMHQKAHRRWASEAPKRYLAAAVAVGTIDQALLSGLQVRHAHLRGFALGRALLVIDEVHASDVYMTHVTRTVLARHGAIGGHALLLSATLGSEARALLLRPGVSGRRTPKAPLLTEAVAVPYPALSDASGLRDAPKPDADRARRITTQLVGEIAEPEAIARRAIDAAQSGARVLIVRNTVAGVIAVQRALEAADPALLFTCEGKPAPHHGRFAKEDRALLDAAIEAQLGKIAPRTHGLIACGSQTLEQSLDIDADFLITDLCPADVLLQRLGRLHRHLDRPRPAGFETPTAVVLTPADRDLSSRLKPRGGRDGIGPERAYENVLSVEATWRALEATPVLDVPAMNRRLVEGATHPEALAGIAEALGGEWRTHKGTLIGRNASHRVAAATVALTWRDPWERQDWAAADGDRATTRLGLDDRVTTLCDEVRTPFDARVTRMIIPGWMVKDVPADATETATVFERDADGSFRFETGGRAFRYTRHGLEDEGRGEPSDRPGVHRR